VLSQRKLPQHGLTKSIEMKKTLLIALIIASSGLLAQNSISIISNPFVENSPSGFFWKTPGLNGMNQRFYADLSANANLRGVDNSSDFIALNIGYGLEKKNIGVDHSINYGTDFLIGFESISGASNSYVGTIRPFIGGEWFFAEKISLGTEVGFAASIVETPELEDRKWIIAPSHRLLIITYYLD